MTPTTYGRDFAYCLKSHGGVRGFNASLWQFLLRCTLFCHSVATFLTSVSSYEGGCGFEAIVKSRPIHGENQNSVLLKMDKVRHFIFVKDKLSFAEKKDQAIFRGKIACKDIRVQFVEKFFGNPRFDIGTIDLIKPEWKSDKISIYDHLKYKYVMALEGNDVASNLKWIMSSNSIAVMPKPYYETWFMEGTLKPDYHYIEVKPDFSDLEEKMDYYTAHPDEAQAIINHAHEYVEQFKDKQREDIISLMVLDKYFSLLKFKD